MMKRILCTITLAGAVCATGTAFADDGHRRGHGRRDHDHRSHHRPAVRTTRPASGWAELAWMDLNRDGRVGWREVRRVAPWATSRFVHFDRNRDGYVTRYEVAPRLRPRRRAPLFRHHVPARPAAHRWAPPPRRSHRPCD